MAAVWFWATLGGVCALLCMFLLAVCALCRRRAKRRVVFDEEQPMEPVKLGVPSILPSGGKHPAGTPMVIIPQLHASVYFRIGHPTNVHKIEFTRLDGQAIMLGAPHPSNIPGSQKHPWMIGTFVVQAFSYAPGRTDSDIVTTMLEITPPTGDVFFSHPPGAYDRPFELTLFHPDTQNILYTDDGSDPFSNGVPYKPPLRITRTTEIRAAVQGCRTPAEVHRYVVPERLPRPLVFVAGDPVAPDGRPVALTPDSDVTFSAAFSSQVLYAAEREGAVTGLPPSCLFAGPIRFSPGWWLLKLLAVKPVPEWLDSSPLELEIHCHPRAPVITCTSATAPAEVYITADPDCLITYRVNDAVNEVELLSPAVYLANAGRHYIAATSVDPRTGFKSMADKTIVLGGAPVEPVGLSPASGRYTVDENGFFVVATTRSAAHALSLAINGEAVEDALWQQPVAVRCIGDVAVTARAVLSTGHGTGPASDVVTYNYHLQPPAPRIRPAGDRAAECRGPLTVRLMRPPLPSYLPPDRYVIHYEVVGQPAATTDQPEAAVVLHEPGEHLIKTWGSVDDVRSVTAEGHYIIGSAEVARRVSPVARAPAPEFYPVKRHHRGTELEVHVLMRDGEGTVFYGLDAEPSIPLDHNVPIMIEAQPGTKREVRISAYSEIEGRPRSRTVTKVYCLDPAEGDETTARTDSSSTSTARVDFVQSPVLTCHAVQLMLELRPADDTVVALYTLDGSTPTTVPEGSTRQLAKGHTIMIPGKGVTEVKALCVDAEGKRPPSRVVSKVFAEGAPYLPLARHATSPNRSEGEGSVRAPTMIAHARVVVVVPDTGQPDDVVRYALDGTDPHKDSPILPRTGLQIAVRSRAHPVILRVAAFDKTNTVMSAIVVHNFVQVPESQPHNPMVIGPPSFSGTHPDGTAEPASYDQNPAAATFTQEEAASVELTQAPLPSELDATSATDVYPMMPAIVTATDNDAFGRGFRSAKLRAEKRAAVLASLKEDEMRLRRAARGDNP